MQVLEEIEIFEYKQQINCWYGVQHAIFYLNKNKYL